MSSIGNNAAPVLVSVNQAASALQVSTRTIRNLIDAGKLPVTKIANCLRIPVKAIDALITPGAEQEYGETRGRKSNLQLAQTFIIDSFTGAHTTHDSSFDSKARQVIVAYKAELERQRDKAPLTEEAFERVTAAQMLALVLQSRLAGKDRTEAQERAFRILDAATRTLGLAHVRGAQENGFGTFNADNLATKFMAVFGLSEDEAERDASEFVAKHAAAWETAQKQIVY